MMSWLDDPFPVSETDTEKDRQTDRQTDTPSCYESSRISHNLATIIFCSLTQSESRLVKVLRPKEGQYV